MWLYIYGSNSNVDMKNVASVRYNQLYTVTFVTLDQQQKTHKSTVLGSKVLKCGQCTL